MSCQVKISQGIVQGETRSTCDDVQYYAFEGIPYAKPPVGELRFRVNASKQTGSGSNDIYALWYYPLFQFLEGTTEPCRPGTDTFDEDPQEPESWTGIRDATKPGNKCPQINPSGMEGSEDCLYLNVYTPSLPVEKNQNLPVLFFVHGGRLLMGHGNYYQPDYFIHQNVILVTCNYRLNVLGFLCLHIPEAPGNVACKDTVMVLKWINKNISNFNGDPGNVTAFGESAGAAIVTSFLTSKMTDGLFHKVIAQSGGSLSDLYIMEEDPVEKAAKIASILGKKLTDPRQIYDFLVKASIDDLISAFSEVEFNREPTEINAYFTPVVEKKFPNGQQFFDEYPYKVIKENRFKKLPILVGLSTHEGALFIQKDEEGNIKLEDSFNLFVPKYLLINRSSDAAKEIGRKLYNYYFRGKNIKDMKSEYITFVSDTYFVRDLMYLVEMISKYSDNLYLYRFLYKGNMNTRTMKSLGIKGTSHGDIIQYEFYKKSKHEKATEDDLKVVKFITESWSNFAKYGKPSCRNQKLEWLPHKPNKKFCLNIDKEISADTKLDWDPLSFWRSIGERSKL